MATPISILKTYFETGKKPTQQQFYELLEAFVHRDEDLQSMLGAIAEVNEAEAGQVNDKYMTPYLTRLAINALTRLANIPDLEQEVVDLIDAAVLQLNQQLNDHVNDLTNPHAVTKQQVGLGNLPNSKSDSTSLDDSNVLATSRAVKLLNDVKEPVFSKKTGFNKNFGTTSGTVAEGNHTHTSLVYSGITKALATSTGVTITGKLAATDEVSATYSLMVNPQSSVSRRVYLYRFSNIDRATLRVDNTSGTNWNGAFEFLENGDMTFSSTTNRIRDRVTGTVIGSTSDERLKRNVQPIESVLSKLNEIIPVLFLFHNKEDAGKIIPDRLGFIAQQVEEYFPEIVDTATTGLKSIDYTKLPVLIVKAIQDILEIISIEPGKLAFFGNAAISQPVVPVGSSLSDVIQALQNLGLFKQE